MDWEKKIELCTLGNRVQANLSDRKDFNRFTLDNMKEFDLQAWDMFLNGCSIITSQMIEDIDFWKKIIYELEKVSIKLVSIRSQIRCELIINIVKGIDK